MPLRETAYQGYTFLALIYVGALGMLMGDLLSPVLSARSWPLRLLGSLLLCAVIATMSFFALWRTHCAQIRLYTLLGLIVGGAVYRLGLRSALMALIKFLTKNRNSAQKRE